MNRKVFKCKRYGVEPKEWCLVRADKWDYLSFKLKTYCRDNAVEVGRRTMTRHRQQWLETYDKKKHRHICEKCLEKIKHMNLRKKKRRQSP